MTMDDRRIATYDDTGKIPVERIPAGTIPIQVVSGADGPSAYALAVANGFVGTEAEWLASLVGPPGQDAAAHPHPYAPDLHALDGAYHSNTGLLPSPGQKNALAGTQGTPGDTNRFVTHQDARLSDSRAPTPHVHVDADLPAAITRDAELTAAIAAHEAAGNPHAGYATDGDLLAHAATPHGGAGGSAIACRKAADQSVSTTAFADSTGMALAVPAPGTYAFEFHVYFTTNAATVGIKLGVNGPAQSALRFGAHIGAAAPSGAGSALIHSGAGAAYNAEALAATAGPGTAPSYAIVTGTVVATAAGNLQLRHGSETASATTILAGSWGRLTPIA